MGGLPDDAKKTATEYAGWVQANRNLIPNWFPVDHAKDAFAATYPFHPSLLSVFERKWQALPRFQQTRGILRLLALWVANAYQAGFKGAHKDPLIGMGTAPLDDPLFRSAIFEQLGGAKLEGAVTTDICGKKDSHALRLDKEAVETISKARLHQKVATTIFFESNGGQAKAEATLPEIRLAVAVVLPPDYVAADKATRSFVDAATKEHGSSARTFKSGLIWAVPEGADSLRDDARKVLAWEDIADEEPELRLDDGQKRQLAESLKKAQRDIKETVWRTYKNVMLLGKDGEWKAVDLGLVHSSAAPSIGQLIIERLVQAGDIEDKGVSPRFLVANWPPAFKEWNTRSVRDAFFASPKFPRLLNPDSIKDTIARGVENGMLGYVGKKTDGSYAPFHWKSSLPLQDVEISDDIFLIQGELAEAYKAGNTPSTAGGSGAAGTSTTTDTSTTTGTSATTTVPGGATGVPASIPRLVWNGDVPHQKWMNFYTKVLSKFAATAGLKLTLRVEVAPPEGVSPQKVDETKVALRELGLKDSLEG